MREGKFLLYIYIYWTFKYLKTQIFLYMLKNKKMIQINFFSIYMVDNTSVLTR